MTVALVGGMSTHREPLSPAEKIDHLAKMRPPQNRAEALTNAEILGFSPDEVAAIHRHWDEREGARPSTPTAPRRLSEYYENPSLLAPPPIIVPRLAWAGRSTLLAAPEKSGKSTLLRSAVRARALGEPFLGADVPRGTTVWVAIDEPVGDLVRGMYELGVPGDSVLIFEERPTLDELERRLKDIRPGLLVVDHLIAWAEGEVAKTSEPTEWHRLFRNLNGVLRRTDCAGVLVHHTTRDGQRYADSRQIGAAVDCILEMKAEGEDALLRKITGRGRVESRAFTVRYTGGRYELDGGDFPLVMRVYLTVQEMPGCGKGAVRTAVTGKSDAIDQALNELIYKHRVVEDRGHTGRHAYYAIAEFGGASLGQAGGKLGADSLSHLGQTGSSSGQAPGQGSLPHPLKGGVGASVLPGSGADRSDVDETTVEGGPGRPVRRNGRGAAPPGHVPVIGVKVPPCSFCGTTLRRTVHRVYRCPLCLPDNAWADEILPTKLSKEA